MLEWEISVPDRYQADAHLDHGYILINAAECEPGLYHNIRQIEQQSDKIVRGVKQYGHRRSFDKAIFAIKKKMKGD